MKASYISWWWQKSGNDGRRNSGRACRRSLWHILVPGSQIRTLCGREANLYPQLSHAEEAPDKGRTCCHCRIKFNSILAAGGI